MNNKSNAFKKVMKSILSCKTFEQFNASKSMIGYFIELFYPKSKPELHAFKMLINIRISKGIIGYHQLH